ncbi:MAG: hypothetical protein P1V34_14210 [Alphaproteobacteria bacterium]|nr:hypothetical protein [Alphaproteobacteria bacterium]
MLSDLALSSVTDILLACLVFFLAGMSFRTDVRRYSPAWYWGLTLFLIGTATMLGAIDHGFFEPIHHPDRAWFLIGTRVTIVIGSFFMILATAREFFSQRVGLLIVGLGGLAGILVIFSILVSDNFLWILGYYAAALVLILVLSLAHLRAWPGARWMVAGVIVALGASVLAAIEFEGFLGLGVYGTYHVILLPSVVFLYLGGRAMRKTAAV